MRHLRLPIAAVLFSAAASAAAPATSPPVAVDPREALVAPGDGVAHYRRAEQARALIEAETWSAAEPILLTLTRDYPLLGTTWGQLALAQRKQGKHAEAIRSYQRVLEIQGPGLPFNARYWIAASHAALGHSREALDTLQQLVDDDAWLERPGLAEEPALASLAKEPRFLALAGKEDVSRLDRVAGWRRDLDVFVDELRRNNPPGFPIPEELLRRQRELAGAIPDLTDLQVAMELGRMMHALGRGHTGFWLGMPGRLEFRSLPVRFYVFPEGLYVIAARPGYEKLVGARVLRFGDTPAEEALARVATIQSSESVTQLLWLSPFFLAIPDVLEGLGIASHDRGTQLTLAMPDGSTVVETLPPVDPERPSNKLVAPPNVPAPLFLRRVGEAHWLQPLPERDAVYVQVNNVIADEDETMAQLGLRLRKVLAETAAKSVVLDLRHNNGGNTFTYQELLRTLTAFSTVEGRATYVLIGRNVYSAAANLSTDLERMVQPVFVGEPTSQTGNQWGDESQFVLPWSGLAGAFSGRRWQLSHPWDRRRSIVPQVPVQLTAKAYFAGEDPALAAVFRLIDEAKPAAAAATPS